jgi:hypothetical protein
MLPPDESQVMKMVEYGDVRPPRSIRTRLSASAGMLFCWMRRHRTIEDKFQSEAGVLTRVTCMDCRRFWDR